MTRRRLIVTIALCCVAVALVRPAWGCDIPVHVWALERWAPDPYPVVVFYEAELSQAERAALDRLRASAGRANLVVQEFDVTSTLEAQVRSIWEAQKAPEMPWVVVRHPIPVPPTVTLWSGRLDDAAVDAVIDSPKRREIAQYLVEADAVVWVLLDADEATANALGNALDLVRKNPPEPTPTPGGTATARVFPLPRFPIVRMNGDDPAEQVFAEMLLGVESDLKGYKKPMAFPVFGRGRALYALVGAGINPRTVRNACAFLLGGCSCQVKEQNPGMDLLLAVDWDDHVGGVLTADEGDLPPLPGVPQQDTIATAPAPASVAMLRNLLVALALGVLVVAAVSLTLWKVKGAHADG